MCGGSNVSNRRLLPRNPDNGDIAVWDGAKWLGQPGFLKLDSQISGSVQPIKDSLGNISPLNLSTNEVFISQGTFRTYFNYGVTGDERFVIGGTNNWLLDRAGSSESALRIRRARGTLSDLLPVLNGDTIMEFGADAYSSDGNYRRTFNMIVTATQDFATNNHGSRVNFEKVKNGAGSRVSVLILDQNNNVGIGYTNNNNPVPARLSVMGEGTTNSTFSSKIHNSTGTSNTLVVRDDVRVGIGTDFLLAKLHIYDATSSVVFLESPGTQPAKVLGIRNVGTQATPIAPTSGSTQFEIGTASWDGTNFGTTRRASIRFFTTENWTATGNGTGIVLTTVLNGSLGMVRNTIITENGSLILNNTTNLLETPKGVLDVRGSGNSSSTVTAAFNNSIGTSNTLIIRDDVSVGIGTNVINAFLQLAGGITAKASLNIAAGVAPTSPISGDIWFDGSIYNFRIGSVTNELPLITVGMLDFGSNYELRWSNTENDKTAIKDIGLKRQAPGILEVTNGFTGCGAIKACYLITGDLSAGTLITAKSVRFGSSDIVSDGTIGGLGLDTQIAIEHDGIVYYVPASTSKL